MFKIINEFFRILRLSVSSAAFYRDLYSKYQGYGLKYITMVISITSIIYAILFMYNLNMIASYLAPDAAIDENPVEFIIKDWPILQYDGKVITCEDATPVYLTNQKGIKLAAIDPAGNLTKDQIQKVPFVFLKDKVIVWLKSGEQSSQKDINSFTFGYDKLFGKESRTIDHDFIKSFILDNIKQVGPITFCIAIPILILLRMIIHILSHLQSMGLLYIILFWIRKKPDISSISRIVFFSSAAAELVTPFVLLIYPPLLPLTMVVEYLAMMLAIYAIASQKKLM